MAGSARRTFASSAFLRCPSPPAASGEAVNLPAVDVLVILNTTHKGGSLAFRLARIRCYNAHEAIS
jgi:hypothetical protein